MSNLKLDITRLLGNHIQKGDLIQYPSHIEGEYNYGTAMGDPVMSEFHENKMIVLVEPKTSGANGSLSFYFYMTLSVCHKVSDGRE